MLCAGAAAGQTAVTTQHNDLSRTGANLNETTLTTANVNSSQFGKLFSRAVDGQIYAQPLYLPAVTLPGQGTHNVIYAATEHNSVYAFDADLPAASQPLWHVNLGPSVLGSQVGSFRDILPEIGITSTPVIDPGTGTLYAVAETFENNQAVFRLHALDVTSGAERFNGPVVISGTVPGAGADNVGGNVTFNPRMQWQRPGLLLLNGNVYIAFGSHQDSEPYHGWLFAYSAATLARTAVLCTSPDDADAGVWQGGNGLTADGQGNIYVQTGHGSLSARDFGMSTLRISTAGGGLAVQDYFSPSNRAALSLNDIDHGAGGPMLIPGTQLLVGGGKDGKLFVLNANNLGKFFPTDQVVQEWQATYSLYTTGSGGLFGGNVFYNNTLYVWGRRDTLKAFAFNGSIFNTNPATGPFAITDSFSNEPAMSISANGNTPGTGILWASFSNSGSDGMAYPGALYAFDAANVSHVLWSSVQNAGRDSAGSWAKWAPPTIANGKVYLATFDNVLNVYGELAGSVGNGTGSMAATVSTASGVLNLTQEGGSDWVHFGDAALIRKAGVPAQIGPLGVTGGLNTYNNDPRGLTWTDGTAPLNGAFNSNGAYVWNSGNGFSVTAPADTTTRTLTVHVGGWNSSGTLTAHLSDNSSNDYVDVSPTAAGSYDRNYTIRYQAGLPGQTLTVSWLMGAGSGNVTISGVALAGPGQPPPPPGQGTLKATGTSATTAASLTSEGPVDWVHWGDGTLTRKAGVAAQISGYNVVGGGVVNQYNNDPRTLSWTDGTPGAQGANSNGLYLWNTGNGFSFTAPADTTLRTLLVHVGGWNSSGRLTAHLSDGSAADFVETTAAASGSYDRNYTITYQAGAAGQTLTVSWVMSSGGGNVTLNGAALAGSGTPPPPGVLNGSGNSLASTVSLTAEGSRDWVHFGDGVLNRKAGVAAAIPNFAAIGSPAVTNYNNDPRILNWSDGTPAGGGSNANGVYISGVGNGFSLSLAADTTTRSITVHVGGWNSGGKLTAHLSDGSAADFVDLPPAQQGQYDRNYTITFQAGSGGQTLTVSWVMSSGGGNVTLSGAAAN